MAKNGMIKDSDGKWRYYKNDKVDTSFTGLAKNQYGWFYMKKGLLDLTFTGVAKNEYGTWCVSKGKLDKTPNGMCKYGNTWYFVKDGKVDEKYNGIGINEWGTWQFKGGKLVGKAKGIVSFSKAQSNTKISKNFTVAEFARHDANYPCKIDLTLINYIQSIRNYFNKSLSITSGYRSPAYNSSIGGANGSYHTKGQACDIVISGIDPELVGLYAECVLNMNGIGIYHDDMFNHLDTRTSKFYWRNQSVTSQGGSFIGGGVSSGSNSWTIKALQTLLNRRGFNCGAVDGKYGTKVTTAVKAAQKYYKLTVDGKAGKATFKALFGAKW